MLNVAYFDDSLFKQGMKNTIIPMSCLNNNNYVLLYRRIVGILGQEKMT